MPVPGQTNMTLGRCCRSPSVERRKKARPPEFADDQNQQPGQRAMLSIKVFLGLVKEVHLGPNNLPLTNELLQFTNLWLVTSAKLLVGDVKFMFEASGSRGRLLDFFVRLGGGGGLAGEGPFLPSARPNEARGSGTWRRSRCSGAPRRRPPAPCRGRRPANPRGFEGSARKSIQRCFGQNACVVSIY